MEPVLTPAHVKSLQSCQGCCNRARPILDYLRDCGVPDEEAEDRLKFLEQLSTTMLEKHQQRVDSQRRGRK